jgi:signal transduction histidine kinase
MLGYRGFAIRTVSLFLGVLTLFCLLNAYKSYFRVEKKAVDTIATVQAGLEALVVQARTSPVGKEQIERPQALMEALLKEQQQQLALLADQHAAINVRFHNSIVILAIALIATFSVTYAVARINAGEMRRSEELTDKINVVLEARVQERTVELAQRTAQLEERSQQLESFSVSVSHDLRAPLRSISGFAQILLRRHREDLNEEGQHFLENIAESGIYMGRLIDDMLSYSRLGRQAVTLKSVNLAEVFTEVVRNLAPCAHALGATLTIPEDLPWVQGHSTLLVQIFTNLLENAVTYGKSAVPVTATVSWRVTNDDVIVSILDNGIGIAPQQFNEIFGVFKRLHSQNEYSGTGIGLAVVKKSVEMQNGKVWLDSTVGVGSTFHVQLPKLLPDFAGEIQS